MATEYELFDKFLAENDLKATPQNTSCSISSWQRTI